MVWVNKAADSKHWVGQGIQKSLWSTKNCLSSKVVIKRNSLAASMLFFFPFLINKDSFHHLLLALGLCCCAKELQANTGFPCFTDLIPARHRSCLSEFPPQSKAVHANQAWGATGMEQEGQQQIQLWYLQLRYGHFQQQAPGESWVLKQTRGRGFALPRAAQILGKPPPLQKQQ